MARRILCIDLDGVVFDVVNLMKEIMSKINYICSEEFKEKVIERAYRDNERELYNKYNAIQKITIDEVLEERRDMYVKRIPYHELYTLEHTFPGVVEYIRMIITNKYFDKIYFTTHVNSPDEVKSKKAFCEKYFPETELCCFMFNGAPYIDDKNRYFENADRKRSNKPLQFFATTKEKPETASFVDDSDSICGEARQLGARAEHRAPYEEPCDALERILEAVTYEIENENRLSKRTKY